MGWTTAQSYLSHGFVDVCEIFIRRPWVLIEPFDRRPGGVARLERQMFGRRRHHHAVLIDTWPQPLVVESPSQASLTASWRSSHPRLGLGAGRALLQLDAMSKRDARTSMTLTDRAPSRAHPAASAHESAFQRPRSHRGPTPCSDRRTGTRIRSRSRRRDLVVASPERRPRGSRIVTRDSVRLTDRFDPFDDQIRSDPYPWYAALRDAAPVHYVQSRVSGSSAATMRSRFPVRRRWSGCRESRKTLELSIGGQHRCGEVRVIAVERDSVGHCELPMVRWMWRWRTWSGRPRGTALPLVRKPNRRTRLRLRSRACGRRGLGGVPRR